MLQFAKKLIVSAAGVRGIEARVREVIQRGNCQTALDIGCGYSSLLSRFRPAIKTVGLDASQEVLDKARAQGQHDDYILADISALEPGTILERTGGRLFDLVTLIDLIEHLPKRQGFELLEKCEQLSSKYIIVNTPNGFLEQGPEFGNKFQRHLSGWFPHDFEGLGYSVYGTFGTKFLRGYGGLPRYHFPGADQCDWLLAALLRTERRIRWAFSLIAIKDIRGVPARLNGNSRS